jgi:exonuclease VII small subunit
MPYIAGDLVAKLTLQGKPEFDRGLDSSGQKFSSLEQVAKRAGTGIAGGLRVAGAVSDTLIVSTVALGAKVFATGLAYNQLQQNSRVALKTLVGGAEAANAQMDKLDAFASNSPFSKATFISAQQQLIGFGVEAQKVVPYLDAIQNAVASIGGSNQDISDITGIIAKIRSGATFGQEDLNQLADKGINAAALIADAQGKTEQEFRDSIYGSPLKGREALAGLDALVEGMDKKFKGAASGVKEQMSGAADRVKAASRDIGSALAEPFVSKNGGGRAVTWANQVADVLRAVQRQTTPFTNWVVTRLDPAFRSVEDSLVGARKAVDGFQVSDLDNGLRNITTYAPALAIVGTTIASYGPLARILGGVGIAINPVVGGIIALTAASPALRGAFGDVLEAAEPLVPVATDLATVLAGMLSSALPIVAKGVSSLAGAAAPLVDILADIPAPVLAGVAAILALNAAVDEDSIWSSATGFVKDYMDQWQNGTLFLKEGSDAVLSYGEQWQQSTVFVAGAGGEIEKTTGKAEASRRVFRNLGDTIVDAFVSNPIGIALAVLSAGIGFVTTKMAEAQAATDKQKASTDALRESLDQVNGATTAETRNVVASMIAQEDAAVVGARNQLVQKDVAKAMKETGANAELVTQAILGNAGAYEAATGPAARLKMTQEALKQSGKDMVDRDLAKDLGVSYDTLTSAAMGSVPALQAVNAAIASAGPDAGMLQNQFEGTKLRMDEASASADVVAGAIDAGRQATRDAADAITEYNAQLAAARAAQSDAARSNERFNEAMTTARDTTNSLEERVSSLKRALDELKGGTVSAADAEAELNAQGRSLSEAFSQTDADGNKLADGLINASGKIDTTTEAGYNLYHQVGDLNTQMLEAQTRAYDAAIANGDLAGAYGAAKDAAQPYVDKLVEVGKAAGLAPEKINALIGTMLAVPAIVAFVLSDEGTIDEKKQGVLNLANQILATPDKTITIEEPMSPQIMQKLRDLGFVIEQVPGSKAVTVSVPGGDAANLTLQNINANAKNVTKTVTTRYEFLMIGGPPKPPPGIARPDASSARGNVFTSPGVAASFANGGLTSRLVKAGGRPLYQWAEPGIGWEAFISGKDSEKGRNQRILQDVGGRLGMRFVPTGEDRPTAARALTSSAIAAPAGPAAPIEILLRLASSSGLTLEDFVRITAEAAGEAAVVTVVDSMNRS